VSPDGKWVISEGQGVEARWSADGHKIYYRHQGSIMEVDVKPGAGFVPGTQAGDGCVYCRRRRLRSQPRLDCQPRRVPLPRHGRTDISQSRLGRRRLDVVVNWETVRKHASSPY